MAGFTHQDHLDGQLRESKERNPSKDQHFNLTLYTMSPLRGQTAVKVGLSLDESRNTIFLHVRQEVLARKG